MSAPPAVSERNPDSGQPIGHVFPRAVLPAACTECDRRSDPRPLGSTPSGWTRGIRGNGAYWCPDCTKIGR